MDGWQSASFKAANAVRQGCPLYHEHGTAAAAATAIDVTGLRAVDLTIAPQGGPLNALSVYSTLYSKIWSLRNRLYRPGPDLTKWPESVSSDVPSQTRVANHFAVAPSVHGVPHLHGSNEPHRTI